MTDHDVPRLRASVPVPDGPTPRGGESAIGQGEETWVAVGGSQVRVVIVGQGPELLLLNGIGAHAGMWNPLVDLLRETRRCILLEMPGTGASPALVRPRRMASLADLVADVLDALGLNRVDVLGYSWGGALAQQFARDHHGRVRRLCLVSTVPGIGGKPPALRVVMTMLKPTRFTTRERAREAAAVLYGGEYRREGNPGETALKMWHEHPPTKAGYLHQLYAITGWSSLMWLHQIRARTLILAGDADPLVPVENVRLMHWLLRDATVHLVSGGGHLWLLDHAEQSSATIERFLSSGPADGPTR